MNVTEAIIYLRDRVRVQREEKTSYNRLRWTKRDLDAVESVVAELSHGDTHYSRTSTTPPEPTTEETSMAEFEHRGYVIEISAIADAADDTEAERIGAAIKVALQTPIARAKASAHPSRFQADLARIREITIANVDGDFLAAASAGEAA